MARKVNRCVLLVVGLLLLTSYAAKGLDDERARASLRGLRGVFVLVEDILPEAERRGLSTIQVQTDVELRLRMAGIRVLTKVGAQTSPGTPFLSVHVGLAKYIGTEQYAHCILVSLYQRVFLARDATSELFTPTWSAGSHGIAGSAKLKELRESVAEIINQFINAYLSVNPK